MANTEYEKALEKARLQAMGAGVNPDNIDPNYARALSNGTDTIYSQTISNSRNGLNRNTSSINNDMQELANMQRKQAIAGLERSRDNALSNLEGEESSIKPMYYDKRNQANVQSKIGAKNFAEYMANRGTRNSGENSQGRLMQNLGLQNALTDINAQEQSALNDIARRRTGVNNAYESDLAGVSAGIEAQSLQNTIQAMQAEQARQDALRQQEMQNALATAGMTGTLDGLRTLEGQQFDMSNDPNSMQNLILQQQLQQLQTQNQYLPQQLQSELASQNALTQSRLNPRSGGTSSSGSLSSSEVNRVVSNVSNVISNQVKSLGVSPTSTDLVQFVNELYPDLSPEAKSRVIRELQGKFGVSPNTSNGTAGPLNQNYLLQQGLNTISNPFGQPTILR